MKVALPEQAYGEPARRASFYSRALNALSALPGARAAGAYAELGAPEGFAIEGRPDPGPAKCVPAFSVSGHYFET